MNTLIQFGADGAVQAVSHFDVVEFEVPDNCILVEPISNLGLTDLKIILEYRVLDGQLSFVGPKPSEAHVWDSEVREYVLDIALSKTATWNAIKDCRNRAEFAGFVWDGSTFDSDPISQSRIQGAVLAAMKARSVGQTFSQLWTLVDNTTRLLSSDDMLAVGEAMLTHIAGVHERGRTLRQLIEGATSKEELDSIVW